MTPLEQFFRLWIRRSPRNERILAGIATAIAVALLAWSLTPTSGSTSTASTAASSGDGSNATPGQSSASVPSTATPGANGAPVASPPQQGAASAAQGSAGQQPNAAVGGRSGRSCPATPPNTPSITANEIRIVIGTLNLGGAAGNSTFGLPSADEQRADYTLVIDAVNKSGGAACRKLVPVFTEANLADTNAENKACLDAAQAQAFMLINGSLTSNACYARAKLPVLLGFGGGRTDEIKQFYPYLFSMSSEDALARNSVFAWKSMNLLQRAGKIGLVHKSCIAGPVEHLKGWLGQAGVPDDQIVTYDFGCPSGFTPPSDIAQAVLKFKSAGVDRVIPYGIVADWANFTRQARSQNFKPKYLISNTDGNLDGSYGTLAPDAQNLADSVGIACCGIGEEHSNFTPAAGTARCNALFAAAGRPPVYQQPAGWGGIACTQVWIVAAIIDHAPRLVATDLVRGLQAAGHIDYSYPAGPVSNAPPGTFVGGQFWRPLQFFADCACWKLTKNEFQPAFP